MKCVCPMGGDRTCPTDCPLAIWAGLSPNDRKAQRKAIVEKLSRQGFPQEQIATQLGVDQKTISNDLRDFNLGNVPKLKTERNPRGAGRPQGSGGGKGSRSSLKPNQTQRQHSINAKPEVWDKFKDKAEAEGKSAAEKLGEMVQKETRTKGNLDEEVMISIHVLIEKLVPLFDRVREQSKRHVGLISTGELLMIASEGQRLLDGWASGDVTVRRARGHVVPFKRPEETLN